ncbi:MAG TPA: glutamate-5-semialdehyde dehydrogenase [Kiritimatiellia bacterium]|nr:glutamate-5-semialdehyde dehydrogenase [Kiritimatiellia bacterium]HMP33417.1 glutamate-5-semialdehyde dehydrogenase [Kiritimatiellia bacterium]
MSDVHNQMTAMADHAVKASRALARLTARKKNSILEAMAEELDLRRTAIKEANARDMEAGRQAGLSQALLDRLLLNDARIDAMIKGIRDIIVLKDPVGEKISRWTRPNGIEIVKVRVPIGVIAIIYESRPNVTCDSSVLCFKTSNAVIMRGGKEAIHSNAAIAAALQEGGAKKGMPEHAIQLVATTDRDAIRELVQMVGKIDLAIPRGGEGLIHAVTEHARIPVIKHYKGVCHVYVDDAADLAMALDITDNAKCQRPGVCNAIETLLVHEKVAADFLPRMAERLGAKGVELRGDEAARAIVPAMKTATEEDWYAEYLDLILAVRVVKSLDEAIAHIDTYGSHHSDAIISENEAHQKAFSQQVDSAAVYVNASTRFTDGGEFGMGAEIGISTDKLHARGPMGLEELTTYKYVIHGTGQIR